MINTPLSHWNGYDCTLIGKHPQSEAIADVNLEASNHYLIYLFVNYDILYWMKLLILTPE